MLRFYQQFFLQDDGRSSSPKNCDNKTIYIDDLNSHTSIIFSSVAEPTALYEGDDIVSIVEHECGLITVTVMQMISTTVVDITMTSIL